MRRAKSRQGFTLIELLAVIAIVLILIGLLIPALDGLRQRAETVICGSKLKQIMSAATDYAGEHNGEYPDCWRWVWSDGSSGLWVEWAQPETVPSGQLYSNYLGREARVFLCPTFRRAATWNPAFSHLTPYVGYSMNEYMWSDTSYTTWNGLPKIRRAQILRPSSLGIFGDEGTVVLPWGPVVINNLCLGVGAYKTPGSYCDALGAFHNVFDGDATKGKGNVAYGDGHVRLEDSSDGKEIFTPWLYKQ